MLSLAFALFAFVAVEEIEAVAPPVGDGYGSHYTVLSSRTGYPWQPRGCLPSEQEKCDGICRDIAFEKGGQVFAAKCTMVYTGVAIWDGEMMSCKCTIGSSSLVGVASGY